MPSKLHQGKKIVSDITATECQYPKRIIKQLCEAESPNIHFGPYQNFLVAALILCFSFLRAQPPHQLTSENSLCIHSRVTVQIQKNVFLADTASGPLTCKFKALSKRNTLEGNIHNTHDLYNQGSGASLNLKALQIWSYLCSNSDFDVR